MIITTNSLNNIETKITTPQINGVEFINTILTEGGAITGINASYNDIMAIIEAGKLPIIVYSSSEVKEFMFISNISSSDPYYLYLVSLKNNSSFRADNATSNMTILFNDQ